MIELVHIRDLRTRAGRFALSPRHHLLRLHVGGPVRVTCAGQREFVRTVGLVDVLPSGVEETWSESDPSHALEVAFTAPGETITPRYHLRDPQLDYLVRALALGAAAPGASGVTYRDGITKALVARLQMAPRSVPTGARLSPGQMKRVTRYIDARLGSPVSLAAIAELVGASPSHARALIRRAFDMPLHRYVVERRVQRAIELLSTTNRTIADIALEVGFAHQSHLTRWLQRLVGHSPAQVRRSARG